ncbi:lipase family protein [Caballeronia sp. SEWSISQ10-4 2]|uniref:lipase family protein n=1 Tax=Caballeronia sp. SEWSISQ10-4 2 TaxID=2937438 RepID=UPI0026564215|nr:lipase family protein [Caballeronia sp. SEWSISQ10-4 2]MDN7180682.1 lipase family protein [Caballeronia sp. SEWSISQ10-4 2]
MPGIPYDATRTALEAPQLRATVFVAGTDYDDVALSVEFARLAYMHYEDGGAELDRLKEGLGRVRFDDVVIFEDAATGTQGYGASRSVDGLCVLAFRGTEPTQLSDLGADLQFSLTDWTEKAGRVHKGFACAARSVFASVNQWLEQTRAARRRLIVTGHSLGAAIATLYASVIAPDKLVTIGSPRVGDADFVATLAGIDMTRLVDCCDVVTELPPAVAGYVHASDAAYLTRDGVLASSADPDFVRDDRLAARTDYLRNYAWKTGNVVLRDLADHAPINYVRCFMS